jgi:preprotein translocase subunit YajC
MAKKLSIGDTVTDVSGCKAEVVAVDTARNKVAIKVTEESGNSAMREGKTYTVPRAQVK